MSQVSRCGFVHGMSGDVVEAGSLREAIDEADRRERRPDGRMRYMVFVLHYAMNISY